MKLVDADKIINSIFEEFGGDPAYYIGNDNEGLHARECNAIKIVLMNAPEVKTFESIEVKATIEQNAYNEGYKSALRDVLKEIFNDSISRSEHD